MKLLMVLSFSLLFSSKLWAQEGCLQNDAQFMGTVFDLKTVNQTSGPVVCTFKIEFSMFNSNYLCPLYIGEVSDADFVDLNCEKLNGDKISGIVYKANGGLGIY